jgi:hypothetical protein
MKITQRIAAHYGGAGIGGCRLRRNNLERMYLYQCVSSPFETSIRLRTTTRARCRNTLPVIIRAAQPGSR